MQRLIIEPVRGQERPSRITIRRDDGAVETLYQVTSAPDIENMCIGRPAEELPRILSILSPSHHLASALALDDLFNVAPPDLAVNMREALLQTQYYFRHLRKIFFILSTGLDPFADRRTASRRRASLQQRKHLIAELMRRAALAQEAAAILGGRSEHPLTAAPGGVTRFLKNGQHERLSEIADACLAFALRLQDAGKAAGTDGLNPFTGDADLGFDPMPGLTLSGSDALVSDEQGKESDRISPDRLADAFDVRTEDWTRLPFVRLNGKAAATDGADAFFVGPLARFNSGASFDTPAAEELRGWITDAFGPPPLFSVSAACWALIAETTSAAEKMKALFTEETLSGPETRTIPSDMGETGQAALESPEGLIFHRYQTDRKGLVTGIAVLDAAAENNDFRGRLIQKTAEAALSRAPIPEQVRQAVEVNLLPF